MLAVWDDSGTGGCKRLKSQRPGIGPYVGGPEYRALMLKHSEDCRDCLEFETRCLRVGMTWIGEAHMPPDLATPFASITITGYISPIAYLLATHLRPHADTMIKRVGIPIEESSMCNTALERASIVFSCPFIHGPLCRGASVMFLSCRFNKIAAITQLLSGGVEWQTTGAARWDRAHLLARLTLQNPGRSGDLALNRSTKTRVPSLHSMSPSPTSTSRRGNHHSKFSASVM